ncbi:prephenate dehydratase domain-containing protein [Bengtsoniella intestinalis]|uniref:bifunctional chorismate mutase/prephenate dehydratase n=1 Tax=Bengtsoniella intestinalis TaxID=3073143 RepID=UPI00391F988B
MELSDIRKALDTLDDQLLDLFLKRMGLCEEVAAYKKANNIPILNRGREREILADVMTKAGHLEREAYHLFATMMELSRSRQAELIGAPTRVGQFIETARADATLAFPQTGLVACQGLEGANTQEACDKLIPRGTIMYMKSFDAVVSAVEFGLCEFGVLPIENSSHGSVRAVYDLLQNRPVSIIRTTRLCIRHELMALAGVKLEDVTEIHSHPQALGQCAQFLEKNPQITAVPAGNTSMAAKELAESGGRHRACISSHPCAALYGLEVIGTDIQDSDNNYTRFVCITKKPTIYPGANRMSLVIACDNKPGALYEILAKFSAVGVNMTKLESCAVTGRNFEFVFFLEVEADLNRRGVIPMLEELERTCQSFHFLGAYGEV